MRKRFVTTLIVFVAAILTALCFAACDGNDGDDPKVAVTGISLNKTELILDEGAEETLTATVSPDNATDKAVIWTTSDAAVATVSGGKVTAVKAGSATITAKAGEKSAACTVTVKTAAPSVAGKTYVYYDFNYEFTSEASEELKNMIKQQLPTERELAINMKLSFGDDGTFVFDKGIKNEPIYRGSYTQNGTKFAMTTEANESEGVLSALFEGEIKDDIFIMKEDLYLNTKDFVGDMYKGITAVITVKEKTA